MFDYNNAGDEVPVSDLVMDGLLTAYETELPEGVAEAARQELFPAFLQDYLTVCKLSAAEQAAVWEIYTLYHALWFSRVLHNEDSLAKRLERGDIDRANRPLAQTLTDMTQPDDGRFAGQN